MEQPQVSANWVRGDAYEQYVGRWSRRVAPLFLDWLAMPKGRRWLDVGCGTGALTAAIVDRCEPTSVTGVEPSEGFLARASENLGGRAALRQGSATAIPMDDGSVDITVSGLVLNFVQDQPAALGEMQRVTGSGGLVAAYVWDYAGTMELMQHFWNAAAELDTRAAGLAEALRFASCNPEPLVAQFAKAGLVDPEVTALDIVTPFASFDDYWQPFLGGQGPAPAYAMSLDERARSRLRERLRERVPSQADGTVLMKARAWAVRGGVARALH